MVVSCEPGSRRAKEVVDIDMCGKDAVRDNVGSETATGGSQQRCSPIDTVPGRCSLAGPKFTPNFSYTLRANCVSWAHRSGFGERS